jgi:hypothetical protein
MKMPNAMNAETLDQFQHLTELNPKSQNYSEDMQALQTDGQELYHITIS